MTQRALEHLSYDEWLIWVFDHPATGPEWHFDIHADWWDDSREPRVTVGFLTRLFENPGELLPTYSDAQIDRGLNFLISPACSDHFFALLDEAVPWERRERGLRAIATLYRELYAKRCAFYFSHLDSGPEPANPLNSTCYMWWDICPVPFPANTPAEWHTLEVMLDVLDETLRLPSPACQEGALHGLGHFYFYAPDEVQRSIDTYLTRAERLHPALRGYARAARSGSVL